MTHLFVAAADGVGLPRRKGARRVREVQLVRHEGAVKQMSWGGVLEGVGGWCRGRKRRSMAHGASGTTHYNACYLRGTLGGESSNHAGDTERPHAAALGVALLGLGDVPRHVLDGRRVLTREAEGLCLHACLLDEHARVGGEAREGDLRESGQVCALRGDGDGGGSS